MIKTLRIFILISGIHLCANAQSAPDDVAATAYRSFEKAIGEGSWLYVGKRYEFYLPNIRGAGYFNDSRHFERGSVRYRDHVFENVPLMYDTGRDLLVSLMPDSITKFSFMSEQVDEFLMFGHRFVYLAADTIGNSGLQAGFYDLVYDGKVSVLTRHTKNIQSIDGSKINLEFRDRTAYYIATGGYYYRANTESEFLRPFGKNKGELRKALRDANVKYRQSPEEAAIILAKFYEKGIN